STEDLISLDSLTGLNNRKRLLNSIADRMHGQSRSHQYLMMIDADHFKAINDTYGHLEGDNALRTLADVLRQACMPLKKRAIIGRYGGDEFIIAMETDNSAIVTETAASIHSLLREASASRNLPYTLSASIGIARCTDDMKTVYDLINAADQKLYEKKKSRT
ncbi:MAG: GGDEF domain-containing protein, partial [Bulleidia sp.]